MEQFQPAERPKSKTTEQGNEAHGEIGKTLSEMLEEKQKLAASLRGLIEQKHEELAALQKKHDELLMVTTRLNLDERKLVTDTDLANEQQSFRDQEAGLEADLRRYADDVRQLDDEIDTLQIQLKNQAN